MMMKGAVDVVLVSDHSYLGGNDVSERAHQVDRVADSYRSGHYFLTLVLAIPEAPLILRLATALLDAVPFGPLTVLPDFARPAA